MQSYKLGSTITLNFPLINDSGETLNAASVSWRLLDELGAELQTWSSPFAPQQPSSVNIQIPDTLTTASGSRAVRTVELEAVGTDGSVAYLSKTFLLQGREVSALVFGVNTFQTYGQAQLLSTEFIDSQVSSWTTATRELQEQSLVQAYQRILQLPIKTSSEEGWSQSHLANDAVISNIHGSLRRMTPAQMANLQELLLVALKKAQLVEAVNVLTIDPLKEVRDAGVLSIKVGESSQFFRAVKPLDFPVCKEALAYLQPWLRINARIGRRS